MVAAGTLAGGEAATTRRLCQPVHPWTAPCALNVSAHGPSLFGEARVSLMRQDLYYSVSEAAAALNVSKMTIYRHIHTGRMDAIRVGTSYRVSATSLERIITSIARDQPA